MGRALRYECLHQIADNPSHATGTQEFIDSEFHRVRDEIKEAFARFYVSCK